MSAPREIGSSAGAAMADAALVAATMAGATAGYGELVRRHQNTLYRHVRGMGFDHDTSLDMVQDAFVRAYTRLADCRDPVHFRAWLFRIARNLCLDHLRNVRQRSVPLDALIPAADLFADRSTDAVLETEMRAALDRLPVALREAFLLKHDAGHTYEEIAVITDSGVSAVKMRVHRAREALREFFDDGVASAAQVTNQCRQPSQLGADESQADQRAGSASPPDKGGTMRSKSFVLVAALLGIPTAVQAQTADARADAQAQAVTPAARIEAAMQAAAQAHIPARLLESKVREGEAKRVPAERIATAVETRLEALVRASETLGRGGIEAASASELAVTADALEAGVNENTLVRISRSAPGERRVVALAVLADLVRLGHDSEPASARVNAALVSNSALANLHAEVAAQLRLGGLTSTLDAVGGLRIQ